MTTTLSKDHAHLPSRHLGRNGPLVPALGFGLMGISFFYPPYEPDEVRFKLLDRAYELGATFWDTADMYGDSEDLVGKWFKRTGKRSEIFIGTKFGSRYDEQGQQYIDSTPEWIREACESSLKRLGVDKIDLYMMHRTDRVTPIEITMKAMLELQKEGKIGHIALSEVSSATLRRACAVGTVSAIEVEYSPFSIDIEKPLDLLKTARELGVSVIAYAPLGRGMATGNFRSPDDFQEGDLRKYLPRFQKENFGKNLELADGLKRIADKKGVSAGQLTLAWLLAQGEDIIPIPGTKKIKYLEENLKSLEIKLTAAEEKEIRKLVDAAVVIGKRYPDDHIQTTFGDTPEL